MTTERPPVNHAESPSAESPTCDRDPPRVSGWDRRSWILAGPAVGLLGGGAVGLIEPIVRLWRFREAMTARFWAEAISFSVVTYAAFGIAAGALLCLLGRVIARLSGAWGNRIAPWPTAYGAVTSVLVVVAIWSEIARRDVHAFQGRIGMATALLAGALLFVCASWICSRLAPTLLGRLVSELTRYAVPPALILALTAVVAQWAWRSQLQSAEGFWPIPSTAPATRPAKVLPDVVLIVFDTLRADRLGTYGYPRPTTPHIDAMAADAVVYERAISPCVWTQPSHASLFTGLFRSQHGVGWNRVWLEDRFVTIAEALRDRGYDTVAVSNNPNVSPWTNMTQGFEYFAEPPRMSFVNNNCLHRFLRCVWTDRGPLGSVLGRWFVYDNGGHLTALLIEEFLRRRNRNKPLFLFINLMESHGPYESTRAYRRAFIAPENLAHSYGIPQSARSVFTHVLTEETVYSKRDLAIYSDMYDARVRQLDDCFADLMRILARELNLDDTLIILTADHGENLGDHDLIGHDFCVYNTLAHVPLIIRWSRMLKPRRHSGIVQTHDLFPTILEWTGTKTRQSADILITSLSRTTKGSPESAYRKAYTEYLHPPRWVFDMVQRRVPSFDRTPWQVAHRAVHDERWKLIVRSDHRHELYDITNDAAETSNQFDRRDRDRRRLILQLSDWQQSFKRFDPNTFAGPSEQHLDEEQLKRLRDLGYVQ